VFADNKPLLRSRKTPAQFAIKLLEQRILSHVAFAVLSDSKVS
jgi:hypothetical protein